MEKNGHTFSVSEDNRTLIFDGKSYPIKYERDGNYIMVRSYVRTVEKEPVKFLWMTIGYQKVEYLQYLFFLDKGRIIGFEDWKYKEASEVHKEVTDWISLRIGMYYTEKAKNKFVDSLVYGTPDTVALGKKFGI